MPPRPEEQIELPRWFREWRTQHFNDWAPLYARISHLSSVTWSLSETLAWVGLVVLLLLGFLMLLRGSISLRDTLARILPDQLVAAFTMQPEKPAPAASGRSPGLRRSLDKAWTELKSSPSLASESPRYFGMGSGKEEVRAVQGAPTRSTDTVWTYGRSEVYFAGDRVVGWRIAPGYPLKAR